MLSQIVQGNRQKERSSLSRQGISGQSKGGQPGGWTGKLLRVDLSDGSTREQDSLPLTPYIGGRGFGARLAWDELEAGIGAFDPGNLLMFLAGPLTGTTAPFSGRGEVCGLGPQGWPVEWFTRSGMGGHWAPEMKYAGYDGVVIKGQAEKPVYLWIHDGKAGLKDAAHLWGLGTYETQQRLLAEHGRQVKVVAIGQAGERLSRIAIINSETESAAGQGGFGAVMGAKKLKAIVFAGSGSVRVAWPDEFFRRTMAIAKEAHACHGNPRPAQWSSEMDKYGGRFQACTQGCSQRCSSRYYRRVPGVVYGGVNKGQIHCVANIFRGLGKDSIMDYHWSIGFEAGFEIAKLTNDYGLNHWDLIVGLIPWLRDCQQAGLITKLDELEIDLDSPQFWAALMKKIAFREGDWGEVLAEGGWRAAQLTGVGKELAHRYYPAWGYSGHWDGRTCNPTVYPYWLVSALQWAVDTRDPLSSGHGYTQNMMGWAPLRPDNQFITWEKLRAIAARVYGPEDELAYDPYSGYLAKAGPAVWHTNRSAIKDCVTVDDQMFPRLFSIKTEDGFARADGMEGPDFEYYMFESATGIGWSREEFYAAAERVVNLERAIEIRRHGRSRQDDEWVIPYFEVPDAWVNPVLGERYALDADKFRAMLTDFYQKRGWDPGTGVPTTAKLESLGLPDVAEALEATAAGRVKPR